MVIGPKGSLTVLGWPCVVDRTLKSSYYYYSSFVLMVILPVDHTGGHWSQWSFFLMVILPVDHLSWWSFVLMAILYMDHLSWWSFVLVAILYMDHLSWWLVFSVIVRSSFLVNICLRVMCLMPVVSSPSPIRRCLQLYAGERYLGKDRCVTLFTWALRYLPWLMDVRALSVSSCFHCYTRHIKEDRWQW